MLDPDQQANNISDQIDINNEQTIDINSQSPALLRSSYESNDEEPNDDTYATSHKTSSNHRVLKIESDNHLSNSESDFHDEASGQWHNSYNTSPDIVRSGNLTPQEHRYRRDRKGLQSIPINSPGEMSDVDGRIFESDDDYIVQNVSRLPRLNKRSLRFLRFADGPHGDDSSIIASVEESDNMGNNPRVRQRIMFRRRKSGTSEPDDAFWLGITVSTILSLAVMFCLVVYLSQTDFFASHQNDLFGTTVDNRFTVVSEAKSNAKIYLKSGYSNSRYSQALLSFGNGELQVGRPPILEEDTQSFYGMSLFNNGSAFFTNKVTAPAIATEYIHASKAVVFDDGTVMTTAANMSGGMKEIGDLNLVSKTGSIIASAGGQPVLLVKPEGTVIVTNSFAEDPIKSGIAFDGTTGNLSIRQSFSLSHDDNSTIVSTFNTLQLNTSLVTVGTLQKSKATITCPSFENSDENIDNNREDTAGDAFDAFTPMVLEIVGQDSINSETKGGDVVIRGGDGKMYDVKTLVDEEEPDMSDAASEATDQSLDSISKHGTVYINAQLSRDAFSETQIGTDGANHRISMFGMLSLNNNSDSNLNSKVEIGGNALDIHSTIIAIDNFDATSNAEEKDANQTTPNSIDINSDSIRLGVNAANVKVGNYDSTTVSLHGTKVYLDANNLLAIGYSTPTIAIGKLDTPDQQLKLHSESISLQSTMGIELNPTGSISAATKIFGSLNVIRKSMSEPDAAVLQVNQDHTKVDSTGFIIGETGLTKNVVINSQLIDFGSNNGTSNVTMRGDALTIHNKYIQIGEPASAVNIESSKLHIGAIEQLIVGSDIPMDNNHAGNVAVGSPKKLNVNARNVLIMGSNTTSLLSIKAVDLRAPSITVGDKSTTSVRIEGSQSSGNVAIIGNTIEVGKEASRIVMGSASTEIRLEGSVFINGQTVNEARKLESEEKWQAEGANQFQRHLGIGILNAMDVSLKLKMGSPNGLFVFHPPAHESFVSRDDFLKVDHKTAEIRYITQHRNANGINLVHLSLSLDGVRVKSQQKFDSNKERDLMYSRLRCRVFKKLTHSEDSDETKTDKVLLVVTGDVQKCYSHECSTNIFLGISGSRYVHLDEGCTMYTICAIEAPSQDLETLLIDAIQLSVAET